MNFRNVEKSGVICPITIFANSSVCLWYPVEDKTTARTHGPPKNFYSLLGSGYDWIFVDLVTHVYSDGFYRFTRFRMHYFNDVFLELYNSYIIQFPRKSRPQDNYSLKTTFFHNFHVFTCSRGWEYNFLKFVIYKKTVIFQTL